MAEVKQEAWYRRVEGQLEQTERRYRERRRVREGVLHQQNPPSLYERHRNQAIFERQGNRNPFIDHPEWVGKVDFRQGLG